MKMFTIRLRAMVCLWSFVAGLFSMTAGPVMAQSSVTVSPGSRISVNTGYNNNYSTYGTGTNATNPGYNTGYPNYNSGAYTGYGYNNTNTPMGNQYQGNYYNPAYDSRTSSMYDQRYNRNYGTRYESSYYYGQTTTGSYELPGLVGAVAGLALGASCFGWMGAIVGGVAGYFVGDKIGQWMYPQGSQPVNPYMPKSKVSLVTGLVGAAMGVALLSSFGWIGMSIGAFAGWNLARSVVKLVAPEFYYYGFQRQGIVNRYGTGQAYYYAPETTEAGASAPAAASNTESASSAKPLSELQEDFYQSMRDYRKALSENVDEEDIQEKRDSYTASQKAYEAARKGALGTNE
jgi:uncharacterized membrane protein YeaQ/YmgE (transglycosylase-associated protein family)